MGLFQSKRAYERKLKPIRNVKIVNFSAPEGIIQNYFPEQSNDDGFRKGSVPDSTVLNTIFFKVENGCCLIDRITPTSQDGLDQADHTEYLDLNGKYIFPGLIDSHVHTMPSAPGDLFMLLHLYFGVTTVRNMSGENSLDISRYLSIRDGKIAGPRFFHVGEGVDAPGSHLIGTKRVGTEKEALELIKIRSTSPGCFGVKVFNHTGANVLKVLEEQTKLHGLAFAGHFPLAWKDLSECRLQDVQHLMGLQPIPGVLSDAWGEHGDAFEDWLRSWETASKQSNWSDRLKSFTKVSLERKIIHTPTLGIYYNHLMAHDKEYSPEQTFPLLMDKAHDTCGADGSIELRQPFVLLGHNSVFKFCESYLPKFLIETMWNPKTLFLPYHKCMCSQVRASFPGAFLPMLEAVEALYRGGVLIQAGTDAIAPFCCPGLGLWQELLLYINGSNLSAEEAISTATILPGAFLSSLVKNRNIFAPKLGRLVNGSAADFIVTECDPRVDLAKALECRSCIVADGRHYELPWLEHQIKSYRGFNESWFFRFLISWISYFIKKF